jgi:hypothetical protein
MTPREFVRDLALRWILPLLFASAILNQQIDSRGLLAMGQLVSTLGTIAAIVIVWAAFGGRWWVVLVVGAVVMLRVARIFVSDEGMVGLLYVAMSGVLYTAAGVIAAILKPNFVARHLWLGCVIGLPLMILQVLGVGEWTQMLRTDLHDEGLGVRLQFPTLFREPGEVVLNVIQSRPAGLFPSNNLLSMIVVFTVAWVFSRPERPRQYRRDLLLLAVAVLTMAKIVMLGIAVVFMWLFVMGKRSKRKRVVAALAMVAMLIGSYAALFPGLFAYNTDWEKIALNMAVRWNDFLYATGRHEWMVAAQANMRDLPTTVALYDESQRQSGYAVMARYLPYLAVAAVTLLPIYLVAVRRLRLQSRPAALTATTVLIAAGLLPLISSFLGAVLFWYLAGAAGLPLLVWWVPAFRALFLEALSRPPRPLIPSAS